MTKVQITDHALVRWLERVRGIDMEALRSELATIAQPYADLKVKHVCVDGAWFVFHDERLVTVTPEKPTARSSRLHDRGDVNGRSLVYGDPLHWKHKKRRGWK